MKRINVTSFCLCCLTLLACGEKISFRGELPVNRNSAQPAPEGQDSTVATGPSSRFFSFTAPQTPVVDVQFNAAENRGFYEFDIQNTAAQEVVKLTQPLRERSVKALKQNSGSHAARSSAQSKELGALDIALIVDNSPSMAEEQDKLAEKLSAILSAIQDVDWRMTIVTTDYREKPGDRNNPRPKTKWCEYLTPQSNDLDARFQAAVRAGIGGTTIEAGFLRMEHLFKYKCDDAPKNWHRTEAAMAVLFVSDEDNCSDGTECYGSNPDTQVPYRSPAQFLELLRQNGKEPGKTARVYGLIGDPTDPTSDCAATVENQAEQYAQVIAQTGGISGPICAASYEPVLLRISKDFRELIKFKVKLEHLPLSNESFTVKINGKPLSNEFYSVDADIVNINSAILHLGDNIDVDYFWGDRLNSEFIAFDKEPQSDTIGVKLQGVTLSPTLWKFRAPKFLQLLVAPPAESTLEVAYVPEESGKGKTKFQTGVKNAQNPEVWKNGKRLEQNQCRVDREGNLEFAQAPEEESIIELRYDQGTKKQNRYTMKDAYVPGTLKIVDAATNATLMGEIEDGELTISEKDAQTAKRIRVTFTRETNADESVFHLPSRPLRNRISAFVDNQFCDLEVSADLVAKVLCPLNPGSKVQFRYTEETSAEHRSFTFDKPVANVDAWDWAVFVDSKPSVIERVSSNGFVLTEQPESGARIELTLTPK